MGVQQPNSTNYQHPNEPNLLDLTNAMSYNDAGEPLVRTHVDGITLQGDVIVDKVKLWDGTNNLTFEQVTNDGESGQASIPSESYNMIFNGTNWDRMRGTINDGVLVELSNSSIAVTGTVALDTASLTALENINATVSGTVSIGSDGTVSLSADTLSALENITVSGTVNIGTMPEVEIKNDTGNPIPISATTAANSSSNPIYIEGIATIKPDLAVGNFYGEPYAISLHPLIQFNGHDGIRPNDTQTYTALSGSTTVVDGVYNIACSTTAGSYGVFRSRRLAVHRAGQSNVMRFLAKFDTAAANTQQMIGAQNQESSFYIGYNGTQFGLQHTYGGRAAIYSLKINSYTGNQTVTLTLNSTVYTISIATGETVNKAAQRIAASMTDGVWLANQVDDTVHLMASSNGDKTGTFSVTGSGNLNATLTRQVQGVANTTEWKYKDVDFTIPAAINLAEYNEWQIKYDWVGATFFVLNVQTNQFELFHRHIHNSVLEVKSASFKIAAVCYNTGGSNAVTLKVASMMAALEGEEVFNGFPHSTSNTQISLASNKYWHLVTLQNPYVFDNKINTRQTRLLKLTVAAESGDPVQIMLVMDAALSTAIYNYTSQDSFMVSFDNTTEAEVNMTNNYPVLTMACPKTGGQIYELRDYNLVVPPGARLSVVAFGTAAISRITTAINWINK